MYFINLRRRFVSDPVWYSLGVIAIGMGCLVEGSLVVQLVGSVAVVIGTGAAWMLHRRAQVVPEGGVRSTRPSAKAWAIFAITAFLLIGLSLLLQR